MTVYGTILEKYSGERAPPGTTLAMCSTALVRKKNRVRAARKERCVIHEIRSCASLDGPGVFWSTPGARRSHGVTSPGPESLRTRPDGFGARLNGISRDEIGITRLRDKLISPTAAPTMPCGAGSSSYVSVMKNP